MFRQHKDRPPVACPPQSHDSPCGDPATPVAAKRHPPRHIDTSVDPSGRRFDYPAARNRFAVDQRLWGGVLVHGAAGRAGSLEGTPPRYFYALTTISCPTFRHSGEKPGKPIDSRPNPVYKSRLRLGYFLPALFLQKRFSAFRSGFSGYLERPHECQIGSGDVIRPPAGQTFESCWIRSSASRRLRFSVRHMLATGPFVG